MSMPSVDELRLIVEAGKLHERERRSRERAQREKIRDTIANFQDWSAEELLEGALDAYKHNLLQDARHLTARWLLKARNVVTEPTTGNIYVYDPETGHYQVAGEKLLRADMGRALGVHATKSNMSEALNQVSAHSYKDTRALERTIPPNLIPFKNGVLNIATLELHPHSPDRFFTYVHPVEWRPEANGTAITTFLSQVVDPKDVDTLIDIAALVLYRARLTRHFFILYGSGSNGKSLFLEMLRAFIGPDRCVSVSPQAISGRQFAPVLLHDRHANLGGDIAGGVITDVSVIKAVTGGDAITVERKGQNHFETRPYCELVYSSNDPPRISESTQAIWERLIAIRFSYSFVQPEAGVALKPHERIRDTYLGERLCNPAEQSSFANVAIQRLRTLVNTRCLTTPHSLESTRKTYETLTNPSATFLAECCDSVLYVPGDRGIPSTGWTSKAELYAAFKRFCVQAHVKIPSSTEFAKRIKEAPSWAIEDGKESAGDTRVGSYRYVALRPEWQVQEPATVTRVQPVRENPYSASTLHNYDSSKLHPEIEKSRTLEDTTGHEPGNEYVSFVNMVRATGGVDTAILSSRMRVLASQAQSRGDIAELRPGWLVVVDR